ncbi:MAG: hypothetical protein ACR2P4_03600 [Gammaproteobacteria bacterium]
MMTSALCALRVLPFAAAKPPFALSRKWTNDKEMDSRFRGNDEIGGNDEEGGNDIKKVPSFPPSPLFPRKRESKRARKGALAGLLIRVLPFAATSRRLRFRANCQMAKMWIPAFAGMTGSCALFALVVCRAFARAGRLAAFADNGIMQRSKPCAVRRAPCAVQ